MAMTKARIFDLYQGDGSNGTPFGYVDGWFINWRLNGDKLAWDLEADGLYRDSNGHPPMGRTTADRMVRDAVRKLEGQEYSRRLEEIQTAVRRAARQKAK